jgi:hypothetical protein
MVLFLPIHCTLERIQREALIISAEPLAEVILALKENRCYAEMVENFPDVL